MHYYTSKETGHCDPYSGQKQTIEIVSELAWMLELADRDFKAPIISTFKNERKSCLDKV